MTTAAATDATAASAGPPGDRPLAGTVAGHDYPVHPRPVAMQCIESSNGARVHS